MLARVFMWLLGLSSLFIIIATSAYAANWYWDRYEIPNPLTALVNTLAPTPIPSSTPAVIPTPTPTETPTVLATAAATTTPSSIKLEVPFIAQAPTNDWPNPIFQDGCEEASVLMAMQWIREEALSPAEAKKAIEDMTAFQAKTYKGEPDRSAADTAQMIRDYYGYENITVHHQITIADVIAAVQQGDVVIVPVNGRLLRNPHYNAPGPQRHMLVVIGYDAEKDEVITNDPGTRHGANYRYPRAIFNGGLQDYLTGFHKPIPKGQTAMIVVSK
jgi:hypothetical protein